MRFMNRDQWLCSLSAHRPSELPVWISLFATLSFAAAVEAQPPQDSLRLLSRPFFAVGVGVDVGIVDRPGDWELLTSQFEYLTPENCMKMQDIQPAAGRFRFEASDRFVQFATEQGMKVVGHCLVWAKDDRTPGWFFQDGEVTASPELLMSRMQTHIETIVGRYKGRIVAWDVVNEALADGSEGYLRDSGWSRATGEEFIVRAFECAHAADPQALLIYNDYRCDTEGKRARLVRLAGMLKARAAPVHAFGLQGHYELDSVPYDGLEEMLQAISDLGFKIVVSELDIDIVTRGRWWAEDGRYRDELATYDPFKNGCPPDVLERQAEQYARLFALFAKYGATIERVSFWNLHDGQSWLNSFPWRRVNHPLLFDRQGQPKPAFYSVTDELRRAAGGVH